MIPKKIKYNLHYDNVRGDFLRPLHGTTPAAVELKQKSNELPLETNNTQNRDWLFYKMR